MTQHTLAILVAAGLLLNLLPGSTFKTVLGARPKINWDGPHIYIGMLREAATIWLLITVLA